MPAYEESFADQAEDTAKAIRRGFERRAMHLGATVAQWRLLAKLATGSSPGQLDLAGTLDKDPVTLSRMVDRLERLGLVERSFDMQDRRAWRVHLTQKGGEIVRRLEELAEKVALDVLDGVAKTDQAIARRVLAHVRDNLDTQLREQRRSS